MKRAVLVTGSKDFYPLVEVQFRMTKYPPGTIFIHGNADGVDKYCKKVTLEHGYPQIMVPYFSWLGKAGGPVRNGIMLDVLVGLQLNGYVISVEAFPNAGCRGTRDMIAKAHRAKVPTHIYGQEERDNAPK